MASFDDKPGSPSLAGCHFDSVTGLTCGTRNYKLRLAACSGRQDNTALPRGRAALSIAEHLATGFKDSATGALKRLV